MDGSELRRITTSMRERKAAVVGGVGPELRQVTEACVTELRAFADKAEDPALSARALCLAAEETETELHDASEAVALFIAALRLNPFLERAAQRADQLLQQLDRTDDRLALLKERAETLDTTGGASDPVRAAAWRKAAKAHQEQSSGEALALYEQAVALDPDMESLENLAKLYLERGEPGDEEQAADILTSVAEVLTGEESVSYASQALDLMPDHQDAMALLEDRVAPADYGKVLRQRFVDYIARAGDDEDADPRRIHLARLFAEDGQIKEAITCLAPAVNRGDTKAAEVREQLLKDYNQDGSRRKGTSTLVGVTMHYAAAQHQQPSVSAAASPSPVAPETATGPEPEATAEQTATPAPVLQSAKPETEGAHDPALAPSGDSEQTSVTTGEHPLSPSDGTAPETEHTSTEPHAEDTTLQTPAQTNAGSDATANEHVSSESGGHADGTLESPSTTGDPSTQPAASETANAADAADADPARGRTTDSTPLEPSAAESATQSAQAEAEAEVPAAPDPVDLEEDDVPTGTYRLPQGQRTRPAEPHPATTCEEAESAATEEDEAPTDLHISDMTGDSVPPPTQPPAALPGAHSALQSEQAPPASKPAQSLPHESPPPVPAAARAGRNDPEADTATDTPAFDRVVQPVTDLIDSQPAPDPAALNLALDGLSPQSQAAAPERPSQIFNVPGPVDGDHRTPTSQRRASWPLHQAGATGEQAAPIPRSLAPRGDLENETSLDSTPPPAAAQRARGRWLLGGGGLAAAAAAMAWLALQPGTGTNATRSPVTAVPVPIAPTSAVGRPLSPTALTPEPASGRRTADPVDGHNGQDGYNGHDAQDSIAHAPPGDAATLTARSGAHGSVAPAPIQDVASSPRVFHRPHRTQVKGAPVDRARLLAALDQLQPTLGECYDKALRRRPNLDGYMVFALRVSKNQQRIIPGPRGNLRDRRLARCIGRMLEDASLPRPKRGTARLTVPLYFKQ